LKWKNNLKGRGLKKMGKAIIQLTPQIIFKMLKLDKYFTYKRCNYDFHTDMFSILIENEEIPETKEGERYPFINITYKQADDKNIIIESCELENKTKINIKRA
jgi:hypothetical protein